MSGFVAEHHWLPGRYGRADGPPGLYARVMQPLGIASLVAHRDAQAALIDTVRDAFGLDLPATPSWGRAPGLRALWAGPGKWLIVAEGDVEAALTDRLGAHASVTDQTDARTVMHISGVRAADALARGIAVDLHPRAFATGRVALTMAAHVAVVLWREDDAPTYGLAVPRSLAGGVAGWLIESSLEYGLMIERAGTLLP